MTVSAHRGEDHLLLSRFSASLGLADGGGDCVGWLRGRDHTFGSGEFDGALEAFGLSDRHRLDQAEFVDVGEQGRHPVIAESSGVDRVGDEVVTERVHLHERGHTGRITEVVGVDPFGE